MSERRPLSRRTKVIVFCGAALAVALVVGVGVVLGQRRMAIRATEEKLREVERAFRDMRRREKELQEAVQAASGRTAWKDAWERPILMAYSAADGGTWGFWSMGPNGEDERGRGDDILLNVNLRAAAR